MPLVPGTLRLFQMHLSGHHSPFNLNPAVGRGGPYENPEYRSEAGSSCLCAKTIRTADGGPNSKSSKRFREGKVGVVVPDPWVVGRSMEPEDLFDLAYRFARERPFDSNDTCRSSATL